MQNIRLMAMDMDGTLLSSRRELTPGTLRALEAAREAGIHLALCSGRAPGDLVTFAMEYGLQDVAILALNGTYCKASPLAEPFADHVFPDETTLRLTGLFRKGGLPFCCFAQNRLVVFNTPEDPARAYYVNNAGSPWAPEFVFQRKGLQMARPGGVNKLLCIFQNQAQKAKYTHLAEAIPGLDVSSSMPDNLEIMPLPWSKGTAVKELAEHWGLDASQVMTFGDWDNDLSMIEYAGWGVAMRNGSERMKKAARLIAPSNDEDGVAQVIWQVLKQVSF